jgi:signal peptidase I
VRDKRVDARPYNQWWFYPAWIIGGVVCLSALVEVRGAIFGYETFRIPSIAMAPTLEPGDYIMVDTWRYRRRDPSVGDVVVFRNDTGTAFVKRVVGTPGDQLEIKDGVVYRNGQPLAEPYVNSPLEDRPYGRDIPRLDLGESEYYVLGDFRDQSIDSRRYGAIQRQQILGRVEYIGLAMQRDRFPVYLHHDT